MRVGKTGYEKIVIVTLLAAGALLPPEGARADSIYRPHRNRSMYADRKAGAVGDVITVIVSENTVSDQRAESAVSREANAAAGADSGLLKFLPLTFLTGRESHSGSGSTTRSSRLVTHIACRVVEVLPNGQLVIEGHRALQVNNDTQTLTLRGVVRPEDVDLSNTVPSTLVADAEVRLSGKGPIHDRQKPGILSRIFRFLF